jgi:hypothetical protein
MAKDFLRAQKWWNLSFDQFMDYNHEKRKKRQAWKTTNVKIMTYNYQLIITIVLKD